MQAITWWDFSDRGAWQRAAAGWLRKDMSPKPVYGRMKDLVRGAWWTKTRGKTGADGTYSLRAFYGDYLVSVEDKNGRNSARKFHWTRQSDQQPFTITL